MRTKHPDRSERLREFFNRLRIKNKEMATKLGTNPAYVSQLLNKHTTITADVAFRIHEFYPRLNMEWLLTGNGDMLDDNNKDPETQVNEESPGYKNEDSKSGGTLDALITLLEDYDRRITELEEWKKSMGK